MVNNPAPVTKLSFGALSHEAWVCVNGQPVEIYSIKESQDGRKLTGFIESREGEQFTIHSAGPKSQSIVTRPYGDGTRWGGGLLIKSPESEGHYYATGNERYNVTFSGLQQGDNLERPFLFNKLNLTDDQDLATTDETTIKQLGTIQVRIQRVSSFWELADSRYGDAPAAKMIHEKQKKAMLSHQAGLGAPRYKAPTGGQLQATYMDTEAEPYLTFEFRYLSRTLLELGGHVPESDEPVPLPAASGPDIKPSKRAANAEASSSSSNKKLKTETVIILDSDDEDTPPVKKEKVKVKEEKGKQGQKVVIILDED
ncbi:hypothetical protein MNV49_006286 [Pseudohyphozyma bogoriensis]|nr:hypothetical protein MNV49_006286 [Pseudohyphozyma bogoriensis]